MRSHTFVQSDDDFGKALMAGYILYMKDIAPGKVKFLGLCNYFGLVTGIALLVVSFFAAGSSKIIALYGASISLLVTQTLFIFISRQAEKTYFEIAKNNFSLSPDKTQIMTIDENGIRLERSDGSSVAFGSWIFVSHIYSVAQHIVIVGNGQFLMVPMHSFSTEEKFNDFCTSLEKYSNKKIVLSYEQNN